MTIYTSNLNPVGSFGRVAHSLAFCIRKLGYSVTLTSDRTKRIDIAIDGPDSTVPAKYLLTFWEVSELRPYAIGNLKKYPKRVTVTTAKFVSDVFQQHGFKTRRIILGAERKPVQLPMLDTFVFYSIYQDLGFWQRKRAQDVVDAFELAFKGVPDVKLVMKQGSNCRPLATFDRRIEIIREYIPDVSDIHKKGHVFVSACGAEGWGYPFHDAMAFGRPVIAANIGGPLEFLDDSCAWLLPPLMRKSPEDFYQGYGKIGGVKIQDLAKAMRYAYDNKEEVMEKATAAFIRARSFTLDQMTVSVKKAFDL